MRHWQDSPAGALAEAFADIAATRMADFPLLNPALRVEAIGFARAPDGHWTGILITPWSLNLLRLPGAEGWPATRPGGSHDWRFASGDYAFIVAEEARLGTYHLCSLFSPVQEFADHEAARLTALAALAALDQAPAAAPEAPPAAASTVEPAARSRRAFLGLGR